MATEKTAGKKASDALLKKSRAEERKVEARKGSALAKGEKRFEERSKSSDGKSAGTKQRAESGGKS
jgi:hypothetical protein